LFDRLRQRSTSVPDCSLLQIHSEEQHTENVAVSSISLRPQMAVIEPRRRGLAARVYVPT
jgi:hypothetical protein